MSQRDADGSEDETGEDRKGECAETELLHLEKLRSDLMLIAELTGCSKVLTLFRHICLKELRNDLNEQNYTDNSEGVRDRVTDGDLIEVFAVLESALSCGKGRSTCE